MAKQRRRSEKGRGPKAREAAAPRAPDAETTENPGPASPRERFPIVALGASAGGLEAFTQFFDRMPPDSGMAFVVLLHLDPTRPSQMAEILTRHTAMPVEQATELARVEPDHVYVIPPNTTMTIEKGRLRLGDAQTTRGIRLPIDAFFKSLAEDQEECAICAVLSGAGSDGTRGLRAVKAHGGLTIAQDPKSARYEAMPSSAIPTGLVDLVLRVEEMPQRILQHKQAWSELRARLANDATDATTREALPGIVATLRRKTGHDFSGYRHKTIVRRIQRRMQILGIDSAEAYVRRIRDESDEADALFRDLLIGVTQFFRDPDAFAAVEEAVIPAILDRKHPNEEIRVWVPACSTGEEAYSLAILIREAMRERDVHHPVRVFAGDIDEDGLEEARVGRYPQASAQHITPERLAAHFVRQGDMYRVAEEVREMCIFSTHSLIKNPPFSRLDLIACRNFLIYLEPALQARIMPLFHYALGPAGFLFLGSSESLGAATDLFRTIDQRHRIFQRRDSVTTPVFAFPLAESTPHLRAAGEPGPRTHAVADPQVGRALERLLLSRFAPAGVLVNDRGDILYISGRTGPYLEPASGVPSANVIAMARRGLRFELRAAIHEAAKSRREVVHHDLSVEGADSTRRLNLIVRPLTDEPGNELYSVIFEEIAADQSPAASPPLHAPAEHHQIMERLEGELETTRDRLQSTIEELEASNEELKSSNEELLSMNEELQSANEELQTSKEELQSLNEELETVNNELKFKVGELDGAYSDLQNLFLSTQVATIFLDRNLRIKRFTPPATDLFRLIESDVGRSLADITPRFTDGSLLGDIGEVLRTLTPKAREIETRDPAATYAMRIAPYRTLDNRIDGVVLTFPDVTAIKAGEEAISLLASIVEWSQDAITSTDLEGNITSWNHGAQRMLGYAKDEIIGRPILQLTPPELHGEESARLRRLTQGEHIEHFDSVRLRKDGSPVEVSVARSPVFDEKGTVIGASDVIRDITEQKANEREITRHREELNQLVEERAAELRQTHERMRLSERMASLGTLSAGLGHDMGNLLMPLAAKIDLIAKSAAGETFAADLSMIRKCLEQLRHLVNGLRMLAIDPTGAPFGEAVDLREWWSDIEPLLQNITHNDIALNADIPAELPKPRIAGHQLSQAVFNLVHNAVQAMKPRGSGTVTVRARAAHAGSTVQIAVEDDGPGMTPEIARRCLDPFFSTKTRSVSTGLGLALVQGVAHQAGGKLSLTTEPGRGTTFELLLPAAGPSSGPTPTRHTTLSLEDSRTLGFAAAILRALGHHITESPTPSAETTLWIAQATDENEEIAHGFCEELPDRWVILVGEGQRPSGGRILRTTATLSEVRRAIARASQSETTREP